MPVSSDFITVVARPRLDHKGVVRMLANPGVSLEDIVTTALPGLLPGQRRSMDVVIDGKHRISENKWKRVRPKAGTHISVTITLHGSFGRTLLQILVVIAAIAAAYFLGPVIGTFGANLVAAAVLALGNILINALIPIKKEKADNTQSYAIQGLQNKLPTKDDVIPQPLGKIRYAPFYAAKPYTENEGDDQYVVAAFIFGIGPLTLTDFRIGETPIAKFKGVQLEYREGIAGDLPLSLYPKQVIQEPLTVTVSNTDGAESRLTAIDAAEISVDFIFSSGLFAINSRGAQVAMTVQVKIEARKVGVEAWTEIETLTYTEKKQRPIHRTHRWTTPERAQYEVRITRLTVDDDTITSGQRASSFTWTALRTHRPEYPINTTLPLAVAAIRIKATKQLQGMVDTFNAICEPRIPDWDSATGTWISRVTQNPASIFRYVLQGQPATFPVADDRVDLDGPFDNLQDFHEHCADKGLTYNRVHDFESDVGEVLADIAGAGRASAHDRGNKWGVVIDRTKTLVVAHITPRNSRNFKGERAYPKLPDAWRVSFMDETNGWKPAERIVGRPGASDEQRIANLEMPGVTNPTQIWKNGRRRWYEVDARPDIFTVECTDTLAATRGDLVVLSHDILDRVQVAARVKEVDGYRVLLDDTVTMVAGASYACRFRTIPEAEGDGVTTLLRTVNAVTETTDTLTLTGDGDMPVVGDLAMFGTSGTETMECIVKSIERTMSLTDRITLIAHGPEIDTQTDADTPPAWATSVGSAIAASTTVPAVPIVVVTSGELAASPTAGVGFHVLIELSPGAGNAVTLASYDVRHRLQGAGAWIDVLDVPVSAPSVDLLSVYSTGQLVEVQARATSIAGVDSAYSSTVTHTAGATDPGVTSAGGYYSTDIGDGVTTLFTITHNLDSYDVAVIVFDVATKTELGTIDTRRASLDTIEVDFGTLVPTTNQYRVVVQRIGAAV